MARASVARRTREFGIRLALGARPARLLGMVLVENLRVALAGIGAGAVLALALARLLRGTLEDVEPARLPPLAAAAAVPLIAALAAGARPAFRAGRTDPMTSIRND